MICVMDTMAAALWELFGNQKLKGLLGAMRQTLLKLEKAGHVDSQWFNAMGEVNLMERNFGMAARYFQNALDEKSAPEYELNLGNALFYAGDIQGAKRILGLHMGKYPGDMHALVNLANCHLQVGETEKAKSLCMKGLEEKGAKSPLYNCLGQTAFLQGDFEGAWEEFNRAYVESPDFIDALFNRGNMAYRLDRADEAQRDFAMCLRKDENFAPAQLNLAMIHLERGELTLGRQRAQAALKLLPGSVDALHMLGRIHLAAKDFRLARDAFREALRTDGEHVSTQIALARLNILEEEPEEALQSLKKVMGKGNPDPEETLAALSLLLELGEHSLCVHHLEKNSGDLSAEFRKILVLSLWREGRTKDAIGHLERLLQAQGESAETLTLLARMLMQSGAEGLAEVRLLRALELDPSFRPAAFEMARIQMERGEGQKALPILQAIVEHHPQDSDCFYNLACCHSANHNLQESLECLEKALANGFQDFDKISGDKDLDYIRQFKEFNQLAGQMTGRLA